MAKYKFKNDEVVAGTPGVLELELDKPVLLKTFLKGTIVEGEVIQLPDNNGSALVVDDSNAIGATDASTHKDYHGKVQWLIDTTKVELVPESIFSVKNIIIAIVIIAIIILIVKSLKK